jgi:hypothetical protein
MYLLVFYAYINEMHSSRSKIPVKNPVKQRCADGFNSGVKGWTNAKHYLSSPYWVTTPLYVSHPFVAHHQEVECIYTYVANGTCFNSKSVGRPFRPAYRRLRIVGSIYKSHTLILQNKNKKKQRKWNGVNKTGTICCGEYETMTSASDQVHINLSFWQVT